MGRFDAKRCVNQRLSAHRLLSGGDTLVSRLKDADGHECVDCNFGRTLSNSPDGSSPKRSRITPARRSLQHYVLPLSVMGVRFRSHYDLNDLSRCIEHDCFCSDMAATARFGSIPCWRIVFSTFRRCMSFHTARVKLGPQSTCATRPLRPRKRT